MTDLKIVSFDSQNAQTGMSVLPGDLVIDPASGDFDFEVDGSINLQNEMIELFDMPFGDDVDYPDWFSNQRLFFKSDDPSDSLRRLQDVERMLNLFGNDLDLDSVSVTIQKDGRLELELELGARGEG